jgi:hypothetical protein
MTSNNWQKEYEDLEGFVSRNPELEIGMDTVVIPEELRPEFYRLFDRVRTTFVEEKCATLLDEGKTLSSHFAVAEDESIKLLGLTDIRLPAFLNWFLHEPNNGLTRQTFDPLFELLKGKTDAGTFEQVTSRNIERSFRALFRSGYEKWVVLSLVKLLASDRVFNVTAAELENSSGEQFFIGAEGSVPEPKESDHLSFEHRVEAIFMVPDLIVHSPKANRYVGFRTELGQAMFTAKNASAKREWYSLYSGKEQYGPALNWPDLLVYAADEPGDINLVADLEKICVPELIIECMGKKEWAEKDGLEKVKLHHDILKPKLGTYIVSREPVPKEVVKDLVRGKFSEEIPREPSPEQKQPTRSEPGAEALDEPEIQAKDIHFLSVGFDQTQLTPIVEALLASKKVDLEQPRC